MLFNIALYCQIVIGIPITHLYQACYQQPQQPQSYRVIHQVFAWQAGHLIDREEASYGLNGAFPNRLQPPLFRQYRDVSTAWQKWLDLGIEPVSLKGTSLTSSPLRSIIPETPMPSPMPSPITLTQESLGQGTKRKRTSVDVVSESSDDDYVYLLVTPAPP
jgi:hypothetical protein